MNPINYNPYIPTPYSGAPYGGAQVPGYGGAPMGGTDMAQLAQQLFAGNYTTGAPNMNVPTGMENSAEQSFDTLNQIQIDNARRATEGLKLGVTLNAQQQEAGLQANSAQTAAATAAAQANALNDLTKQISENANKAGKAAN